MEKNVRTDMRQASTRKTEMQGVHGGSEASNVVRVGDGGTDEKTGSGDGCGRVEDARFLLEVTSIDKIGNEYIRGAAQMGPFGEKIREACLRWYVHVRRKYDGYIWRRMLRMALPGKRKRGRTNGGLWI